ncbi:hypothetical protein [Parasitella parasitica]|uniref:Uncharacterized protein n=1 Tax=Parasitella parasitica TaxID=35722 RepID=A0A0B7NET1_9FUNG|nr:hypothetical protein [Parasitella parasitica]
MNEGLEESVVDPLASMVLTVYLPKFQLKSAVVKYCPGGEAFGSVFYFSRSFEKVDGSAGQDVEVMWRNYLPLSIPFDYDEWLKQELVKCCTWKEVGVEFVKKFNNPLLKLNARRAQIQVSTLLCTSFPRPTSWTVGQISSCAINILNTKKCLFSIVGCAAAAGNSAGGVAGHSYLEYFANMRVKQNLRVLSVKKLAAGNKAGQNKRQRRRYNHKQKNSKVAAVADVGESAESNWFR